MKFVMISFLIIILGHSAFAAVPLCSEFDLTKAEPGFSCRTSGRDLHGTDRHDRKINYLSATWIRYVDDAYSGWIDQRQNFFFQDFKYVKDANGNGINQYEAAAYCKGVNLKLPTVDVFEKAEADGFREMFEFGGLNAGIFWTSSIRSIDRSEAYTYLSARYNNSGLQFSREYRGTRSAIWYSALCGSPVKH